MTAARDAPTSNSAPQHPDTRTRRRLKLQRELQSVALALFEVHGYEDTTIDEIAAAADISTRTFFRYFPTKEDLVLWDEYDPAFLDALANRPDREPLMQALRSATHDWVRAFTTQDRDRVLARLRLFFSVPTLQGRYWQGMQAMATQIASWMAPRLELTPDALPVRVLSLAFIAALAAATEAWACDAQARDLAALADEALSTLQSGIDKPTTAC